MYGLKVKWTLLWVNMVENRNCPTTFSKPFVPNLKGICPLILVHRKVHWVQTLFHFSLQLLYGTCFTLLKMC